MKQNTWQRNLLLSAAICGLFLLLAVFTIPFSFEVNDDVTMISILNGSYTGTPDGHAIFIGYPLAWLISKCYSTGISICWYKWIMLFICFFAAASLLYRLLNRFPKHLILLSCITIGSLSAVWLTCIMRFTYSTCGAFLAVTTILCYALQPKEDDLKPGCLINILLLYLLTYNLRDYFGYLAIPFLGVIWLCKYNRTMFTQKKCWLIPLAALLCLGASLGIDGLAYRGWTDYFTYNDERCYLQDYYHFPGYSEHEEVLQSFGYDKAEYYTISHYDYCLLEDFGPEHILELAAYARSLESEPTLSETLAKTVKQTAKYVLADDLEHITPLEALSLVLPLFLAAAAIGLSVRDRKLYVIFPALLLFGLACSWLLIGYQGRFPTRVEESLRLLNIGSSLAGLTLLFTQRPVRFANHTLQRLLSCVLCVLFLAAGVWGWFSTRERQSNFSPARSEYLSYVAEHPENIYIRETRSTTVGSSQKLTEFPRATVNLLPSGSWTVYSPLYYEKLEALGLEAVNRDTLLQDNVYLIVRTSKYDLHQVLGLTSDAAIDYTVEEELQGGIQVIKIHEIIDSE